MRIPALLLACSGILPLAAADLVNGLGGPVGFGENTLARNDDGYVEVDLTPAFPLGIRFFSQTYTKVWLNNNGNLTFGGDVGQSTYTPGYITGNTSAKPIIAAWYADVDTRPTTVGVTPGGTSAGTNWVYYKVDPATGIATFTWDDVGYFSQHTDKRNAFQIRLIGRGSTDFSIEIRYENLAWTTGDASGGSNGLGGTVVRAGYSASNGTNFYEFPESGNQVNMLDLVNRSNLTPAERGIFRFDVIKPRVGIDMPTVVTERKDFTATFTVGARFTGFTDADLRISGGTLGPLSGATLDSSGVQTFTATVTPDSVSEYIKVTVVDGAVQNDFLDTSAETTATTQVMLYRPPLPLLIPGSGSSKKCGVGGIGAALLGLLLLIGFRRRH